MQDIVNGKANSRKDSDRTDVDTGPATDTKKMVYSENKGINSDKGKDNPVPGWVIFLIISLFLSYMVWMGLGGNLGVIGGRENSEISQTPNTIEKPNPNQEEEIWNEALSKDIESAYSRYLFLYPDGKYAKEAKKKMDKPNAGNIESNAAQRAADAIDGSMVKVSGGTFIMGCTSEQGADCNTNEKPSQKVNVSSFYINKYEVTQEDYKAIMGSNPSHFKNCKRCPVENVSLDNVENFIKKLNAVSGKNYRLPYEGEWEYAARGGKYGKGYKFAGSNSIDEVAWYEENSNKKTHPVGTKKSNELGLFDLSGNVGEWTINNENEIIDRGGSWTGRAKFQRVSAKTSVVAYNGYFANGIRLAY